MRLLLFTIGSVLLATQALAGGIQDSHKAILGMWGTTAGGAFSASDNFDREDSDPLGALSGGTYTWTEAGGDADIISNAAHLATLGTSLSIIGASRSSGWVQCDINLESSNSSRPGPLFWYEDTTNYWYVSADPVATDNYDLQLRQVDAGVDSLISSGVITITSVGTYTVKTTYSGSGVVVLVDSVEYINYTAALSFTGDVGIRIARSGAATGWVDNFSAGD